MLFVLVVLVNPVDAEFHVPTSLSAPPPLPVIWPPHCQPLPHFLSCSSHLTIYQPHPHFLSHPSPSLLFSWRCRFLKCGHSHCGRASQTMAGRHGWRCGLWGGMSSSACHAMDEACTILALIFCNLLGFSFTWEVQLDVCSMVLHFSLFPP